MAGVTFGERLRAARESRKLTQEQAAEKAGVSVRQWLRYERGETDPKLENVYRFAELLGVDPKVLV